MNVIWIISDTLRRDHVGVYGNKNIRTPSLDAFASKSVRFDRHYIASFPTMPARADYMTGRWTMSYMQWEPLSKDELRLPILLSDQGYHTAAVVDTPFYTRRGMNYDIGFHSFIEILGQLDLGFKGGKDAKSGGGMSNALYGDVRKSWRRESDCFAPQTFIRSMEWLERHYKEDFFLYIDTWDPHEPWEAPAYYTELYDPDYDGEIVRPLYGYWQDAPGYSEEKVKKAHATYCGEVTMVDTWFGDFMRRVENLSLTENTAIIVTSDHGYYFGEHNGLFGKMVFARDKETGMPKTGIWSHSPFYEEVTAIPCLIYIPGIPASTYSGLTSAVDFMPTVLDILDMEIPSSVEGESMMPRMKDPSLPGREYVVSAHPFINAGDSLRSVDGFDRLTEKDSTATVTTDEWTLLYNTEPGLSELYHLPSDPRQEKNVISDHEDKARELHQLLVKYMRETKIASDILERRLELRL
jgi:arylsulfatase A-like enzyme